MVMHVRMQCDAIHIDVMRKITCKVKWHKGLKGRSDMVSTSTHNSPNKVGSNVFVLNVSWRLRSPFKNIIVMTIVFSKVYSKKRLLKGYSKSFERSACFGHPNT